MITTDDDHYARLALDDGREAAVIPLLFGRARLVIGPAGAQWYDDVW